MRIKTYPQKKSRKKPESGNLFIHLVSCIGQVHDEDNNRKYICGTRAHDHREQAKKHDQDQKTAHTNNHIKESGIHHQKLASERYMHIRRHPAAILSPSNPKGSTLDGVTKKPAQKETQHKQNAYFTIQTRASCFQQSGKLKNARTVGSKKKSIRSKYLVPQWTIRLNQK